MARLRPREANPTLYAGLRAAELQKAAYPSVEPLIVSATPQAAYDAAMQVITKWKWRIVDARGPLAGRCDGRIEAVARTPILGFRDDVVVRIRPTSDGARIDVRSASRYGRHDLGTNAARVRALIGDIDDVLALPKKPAPVPARPERRRP